jgi:hypothetical protein
MVYEHKGVQKPFKKRGVIRKAKRVGKLKFNIMLKKIKMLFAAKTAVATANKIKSGYSHGAHDGSASGQWRKA